MHVDRAWTVPMTAGKAARGGGSVHETLSLSQQTISGRKVSISS